MGDVYRKVGVCAALLLLPGLANDARGRIRETFAWKPIGDCADDAAACDELLELVSRLVDDETAVANATAAQKNQLTPGHHSPRGFKELCDAICTEPAVTRLRFWKYAGRDLCATIDAGEEVRPGGANDRPHNTVRIRVRTVERAGLIVELVCDHPGHVERLKVRIEELLVQHCHV